MTTKCSFSLDGEGEDAVEKFGLRSRLDIFKLNLEKMLGILTPFILSHQGRGKE